MHICMDVQLSSFMSWRVIHVLDFKYICEATKVEAASMNLTFLD